MNAEPDTTPNESAETSAPSLVNEAIDREIAWETAQHKISHEKAGIPFVDYPKSKEERARERISSRIGCSLRATVIPCGRTSCGFFRQAPTSRTLSRKAAPSRWSARSYAMLRRQRRPPGSR